AHLPLPHQSHSPPRRPGPAPRSSPPFGARLLGPAEGTDRGVEAMSDATVRAHLDEHAALVRRVAEELAAEISALAEVVASTFRAGGKVLFCGNGGSAADAQHLAAEYVVRFSGERAGLPALALTADGPGLTAS